MKLAPALQSIQACCEQMNSLYGKIIFDEWAVVSFSGKKENIQAYFGPRRAEFAANFSTDVKTLRVQLQSTRHHVGDFDFARDAVGTHYDAFMAVGQDQFLICNSLSQSMAGIAQDSKWLKAQVPFAELADKFRADPLT